MDETEILYPSESDLDGLRQMMDSWSRLRTVTRQLAI